MKKTIINALVYAFMFIAIQALAGIGVHAIWQQIVGGTDITTTELVVTVAVFSLLTIIIFLSGSMDGSLSQMAPHQTMVGTLLGSDSSTGYGDTRYMVAGELTRGCPTG